MKLIPKTYKSLDVLRLVYQASPIMASLYVFLSIVRAIMQTAVALATANFVDTATAILRGIRPYGDVYMPLFILLLVLGFITTFGSVAQLVNSRVNLHLQQQLKSAIVEIHSSLDFKHIENAKSWEVISRVSHDPVKSIMDGFNAIVQFLIVVISVTSVLILIVTQVWWAALIVVAFSVPLFWLSMWAGKKNYQAGRDAEKFKRYTEYLEEVLTGRDAIDECTLFGYRNNVNNRWQEQYEAARLLQLKVAGKTFLITKGSSMCLALIGLLSALTLINPVVTGQMSTGMFIGVVSAVFGMIQQLGWQMSNALENISRVGEYMNDLTEFFGLSRDEKALCEPDAETPVFETLEFRNVYFKYPGGDRKILDGLSFTLAAGHHYAFVGKNGAGKTTIIKLLTGLYTNYEGEILINGKELRTYSAGTLKALFSVVYQDFAKYYITMKENIALGNLHTERKEMEAAKFVGLRETIDALKFGINTPLGKIFEGGQDISGGQWQRVAFARSIVSRAPVKMLDEPTAALDPISESLMYSEFEKLMHGKTTIFISHRLGSTKLADEILVFEDGKIIERGAHDVLLAAKGQYAEMFEAQRGWYL